jgi:antitoxin (DNA-binding transcriptional repressor) of toxin-antitoxin stability system
MATVSVYDAHTGFPGLIERALDGEEIMITRRQAGGARRSGRGAAPRAASPAS